MEGGYSMKNIKYFAVCICAAALLTSCGPKNETAEIKDPSFTEPAANVSETGEETTAVTSESEITSVSAVVSEVSAASSSAAVISGSTSATSEAKITSTANNNSNSNNNVTDVYNPASYSGGGVAPDRHDDHGPSAEETAATTEEVQEPDTGDVTVNLNGGSAECTSSRVSVNGSEIKITAEGIYRLYGSLNGQIVVEAPKDAKIELVLNGVNISCGYGPAIRVESSDKVKIVSAGGTDNWLSDGGSSEACIFSKDDLTLKGDGKITVKGNVKNGVYSKNTLKITGGTFEINSANNGLVGKDKVSVENGNITVNSGRDAIKATNETEGGKGTVSVTGGTINISAGDDAIQAISGVTVSGCSITVRAEGKKVNCDAGTSVDEGCITKIKE